MLIIKHKKKISPFGHFALADQDSVRLISVESCGSLAKVLKGKDAVKNLVVPVLLRFAGDQSWRVRHQAVIQIPDVADSTV